MKLKQYILSELNLKLRDFSGAGTSALKQLLKLADKHEVKLTLFAKGYSNTSSSKLKRWYKKFGFTSDLDDPSDMVGHPTY